MAALIFVSVRLECQILDLSVCSILLYRLDALFHCRSAGVHLAATDNLAVGSLQIEEGLAVLGNFTIITLLDGTVFLN